MKKGEEENLKTQKPYTEVWDFADRGKTQPRGRRLPVSVKKRGQGEMRLTQSPA